MSHPQPAAGGLPDRPLPLGTVPVGTFGGASALPVLVAIEIGAFQRRGLVVQAVRAPGSSALRTGLADGTYLVVHAAPDNVIAWRDDTDLPVKAWIGGSNGPIALVASHARAVRDLRGARIAVDAPGSGFAPILRQILAGDGLAEADVLITSLGATRGRYEALRDGRVDATMLTLPWSTLAERDGATVLADHRAVAPDLLTSCGASLGPWLASADGGAQVAAYLGGYADAVAWLCDPANDAAAAAALALETGIEAGVARDVLAVMRDSAVGWPRGGMIRAAGMAAVATLRATVAGPPHEPVDAYLDLGPTGRHHRAGTTA